MKKLSLFLFLVSCSLGHLYAQAIIDSPVHKFRNTGRYNIDRIELSDIATKVRIINSFIPEWWVQFLPEEVYLEDPQTGTKYPVQDVQGIQWKEKKTTPESGVDTFLFTFPALPASLKEINWAGGYDKIYGIALDKPGKLTLRDKIQGNWWTTDGSNRWEYGIYPDFVIAGNKFWNYTVEKQNKKQILLNLTSGKEKDQLYLFPQKDGNCKIGHTTKGLILCAPEKTSTITTQQPGPAKTFFQPGAKALLQGYIQGYDRKAGFNTGLIYCQNVITNQSYPLVVELDSIGRFSLNIPLDFPIQNSIILDRVRLPFYIAPEDTLTIYANWEDLLQAYRFRDRYFKDFNDIHFMGPSAQINTDLLIAHKNIPSQGNMRLFDMAKQYSPRQFKSHIQQETHQRQALLDSLNQVYHFCPPALRLMQINLTNNMGEQYFDFIDAREYIQRQEPDNAILKTPIPDDYYDFMQQIPLDDEYRIIPYDSWVFINRFEFADPFKSVYQQMDSDMSNLSQVQYAHKFWQLKDSIYTDFFKLSPGFLYDVVKIRALNHQLNSANRETADSILNDILSHIQHPYLKQKGQDIFATLYPQTKVSSMPLPEGKATDIFRKILAPYQGKVIFVDFWATSCGPCRAGIKNMKPIRQQFKDKDIVFLFITDEKSSPLQAYNKFMADVEGEKFRIPEDDYNYLRQLFKFNGIPHYEIINKKGEVVNQNYQDHNPHETQEKLFNQLLEE